MRYIDWPEVPDNRATRAVAAFGALSLLVALICLMLVVGILMLGGAYGLVATAFGFM